jgi:hypothetical protein
VRDCLIPQSLTPTRAQSGVNVYPFLLARWVYQRGLGNVAIDLNKAPGNLSVELSEDATRHFSVDNLERYIEKTGDTTPVYYLIDKFLNDKGQKQDAAMAQLGPMLQQLAPLMKAAGLI